MGKSLTSTWGVSDHQLNTGRADTSLKNPMTESGKSNNSKSESLCANKLEQESDDSMIQ